MEQIGSTPHEGVGSYFQFSCYIGWAPASTVYKKTYRAYQTYQENTWKFSMFFFTRNHKRGTSDDSEDPDEMPHDVTFHQGLHWKK